MARSGPPRSQDSLNMASSSHPVRRRERTATRENSDQPLTAKPPSRRRDTEEKTTEISAGVPEIVLLGCGAAAREIYIPILQALEQAGALRMRAIVGPDESAREFCRNSFPHAEALSSLDALAAPPNTLVIIATATRFHPTQSLAALKRGWHVLCGANFAPTSRDGAMMIAAADRYRRLLAVDLHARFFPATRYLRTLCRDHLLGPPISFRIHDGTPRQPLAGEPPRDEKAETPEGVLTELGLAPLDLLTSCLGSAAVASYADDAMGGVEANAFISLTFPEEVRGTIHLSRDWPTEQSYTFVFERGIVRWDAAGASDLTLQLASAPTALKGQLVTPLSAIHAHPTARLLGTAKQAVLAQIQNILGAMSGREVLRVPAAEAMHSLSIVEECYARRTALAQPWLPRNEAAQARALAPAPALRRP